MKKLGIVILSLLLVLIVGQVVFAKGSIGLNLGYNGFYSVDISELDINNFDPNDIDYAYVNGLGLRLSGNFYLINRLSLSGGAAIRMFYNEKVLSMDNSFELGLNLFARFDIIKVSILSLLDINLGIQAGVMYDRLFSSSLPANVLFLAAGLYIDTSVTPRFNIYADLKIPFGSYVIGEKNVTFVDKSSFFKLFLYDAKLGATFLISPKIAVGVELSINNVTWTSILINAINESFGTPYKSFEFAVGASLVYKF